jgi:cleavage and polyadenylation specificity factor subunit 1
VLPLADVSPQIRNIQDLLFLPGFHSPTLAILYTPIHTWAGRYGSARDTTCLEIRTFDLTTSGSYPLLTAVPGLPSDPLYMIACPSELRGVAVITSTGIIHIDQGGRVVGAGVNAWWEYTTNLKGDTSSEARRISLEGSRAVFVSERDMLLILANGDVHQVRFEMEGRSVGRILVDEKSTTVPPPSSAITAGENAVFIGSAEGDSLLAKVDMVRDLVKVDEAADEKPNGDMEVDYDEDLYGDADGGEKNAAGQEMYTGPSRASLTPFDVLAGIGKIMDMEFGIAATDQGVSSPRAKHRTTLMIQVRTNPQLVTVNGGSRSSTINVFRVRHLTLPC